MSEKIKFNSGWRFHDGEIETPQAPDKGPSYFQAKTEHYLAGPASVEFPDMPNHFKVPGTKGEINLRFFQNVTLPHDYIIEQVPQEHKNEAWGFFDYHPAWYRKHFVIGSEDKNKRITLYFEGVADHATVYFNGVYMYDNYEAHTPFEIDLTDFIRFDEENVISVHVECGTNEGWWYQGGGIYRNVWLEKSDLVSVDRYGIFVHPEKKDGKNWAVPVETTVRNDTYADVTATVKTEILDGKDKVVLTMQDELAIPEREVATLKQVDVVKNPALWDIDAPNLYTVKTTILWDKEETDVKTTTFGFREILFTPENGCYLNGKNIKVKGICGHGDYGLTGLAVDESILRYKAQLIKDMGANAFRCSHYPHPEYFMDQLDRLGILCMDETRWFSTVPSAAKELETLMKRDRNHPSVFMWSIGNEEPFFITEQGARISRSLYATAKKLDPYRTILTANDKDPEIATVYEFSDIVGVNYHMELFDKLHEKYPNLPILSTENSATGTTRNWYHENVPSLGRISAYDHFTNEFFQSREYVWQYIYDRPWLMGGMQWIAFEHRGEAAWPRLCSASGAIDLYLQKKDAFYQNQSFWLDKPMIHVLPHWNHPGYEGKEITVYAYTNCEEAELFLNGKSLGKVSIKPVQHAEWKVVYAPGKLEVVGYIGGKEVARDVEETSGPAYALKLVAENKEGIQPGEVLAVTCYAVDKEGRKVKDADVDKILFFAENGAEVLATGSDNTDHVPPRMKERRMYGGLVSAAVRVSAEGKVKLTAQAPGVLPAFLEF